MSLRYLCVRDFSAGFGSKITDYERVMTESSENFAVKEGALCDLYGVKKNRSLSRVPERVYPGVNNDYVYYYSGGKIYSAMLHISGFLSETATTVAFAAPPRAAVGEKNGNRSVGFAGEEGVYLMEAGKVPVCLTDAPSEDLCYRGGRWFFLSQGVVRMTKPYSLEEEEEGAFLPPISDAVRRVIAVGDRVAVLSDRTLFLISGTKPQNFRVSAVPVTGRILPDSAAAEGDKLYFMTQTDLCFCENGKLAHAAKLPYRFSAVGRAQGVPFEGNYYFFAQTGGRQVEGVYLSSEDAVFCGSGRNITSFSLAFGSGGNALVCSYGREALGEISDTAAVEENPLCKRWISRPTDFGRLNARKILIGVSVTAETAGKLRVKSSGGTVVLPLGKGLNAKSTLLSGGVFTLEFTASAPGSRFVKPIFTFKD